MGNSTMKVQTEAGLVVVRKMPLADYAELLAAFENVPKQFSEIFGDIGDDKLKDMSTMDFMAMLPMALAKAWPDIINLVAVPTDKDAEFLGKLYFADAVDILAAILELNDIPRIIEAVKKTLALRAKLTRPQKQK